MCVLFFPAHKHTDRRAQGAAGAVGRSVGLSVCLSIGPGGPAVNQNCQQWNVTTHTHTDWQWDPADTHWGSHHSVVITLQWKMQNAKRSLETIDDWRARWSIWLHQRHWHLSALKRPIQMCLIETSGLRHLIWSPADSPSFRSDLRDDTGLLSRVLHRKTT